MIALVAQDPAPAQSAALQPVTADALEPAGATLHQWGMSAYCYKVRLAAALKGLRFEEKILGMKALGRAKKATGLGKVPVIETADGWITDSTHILEWLEERQPSPSLYPAETKARVECQLLEDWADEALAAAVEPWLWLEGGGMVRLNRFCADEQEELSGRILMRAIRPIQTRIWKQRARRHGGLAATRELIKKQIALIDARLAGQPWFFGDAPSAADLAVASQLMNLFRFGCHDDVDAHPAVRDMVLRAARLLPGSESWLEGSAS
jgi:glutathione S-transferase